MIQSFRTLRDTGRLGSVSAAISQGDSTGGALRIASTASGERGVTSSRPVLSNSPRQCTRPACKSTSSFRSCRTEFMRCIVARQSSAVRAKRQLGEGLD